MKGKGFLSKQTRMYVFFISFCKSFSFQAQLCLYKPSDFTQSDPVNFFYYPEDDCVLDVEPESELKSTDSGLFETETETAMEECDEDYDDNYDSEKDLHIVEEAVHNDTVSQGM